MCLCGLIELEESGQNVRYKTREAKAGSHDVWLRRDLLFCCGPAVAPHRPTLGLIGHSAAAVILSFSMFYNVLGVIWVFSHFILVQIVAAYADCRLGM